MSFSDYQIPLWRKAIAAVVMIACLLGTLLGLGMWELGQCGDNYAGYCRERNFLDILVIGGLPLIAVLIVVGATKIILREPR